jgi:hypothetical protein
LAEKLRSEHNHLWQLQVKQADLYGSANFSKKFYKPTWLVSMKPPSPSLASPLQVSLDSYKSNEEELKVADDNSKEGSHSPL